MMFSPSDRSIVESYEERLGRFEARTIVSRSFTRSSEIRAMMVEDCSAQGAPRVTHTRRSRAAQVRSEFDTDFDAGRITWVNDIAVPS